VRKSRTDRTRGATCANIDDAKRISHLARTITQIVGGT
jgi:hypothetical protein